MRAFCGRRVFSRGWGFSKTSYVCVGENLARRKLVREPNDGYPSDFALIPAFPSLGLSSMSADAEIPVATLKALPQLKLLRLFHLASSEHSLRECALKHGMTQSSLTRGIHAFGVCHQRCPFFQAAFSKFRCAGVLSFSGLSQTSVAGRQSRVGRPFQR